MHAVIRRNAGRVWLSALAALIVFSLVAGCSDDSSESNNSNVDAGADTSDHDIGGDDVGSPNDTDPDTALGDTGRDATADTGDQDTAIDTGEDTGEDAGGPSDCWQVGLTTDFYHLEGGDTLVKVSGDGTELSRTTVAQIDPEHVNFSYDPKVGWPFAVDEGASKLFWLRFQQYEEKFFRANLDGTDPWRLSNTAYESPVAIQQVPSTSEFYVLDRLHGLQEFQYDGTTRSFDVDTSSLGDGFDGATVMGFHVDAANDLVYWGVKGQVSNEDFIGIYTTDIAGENPTLIVKKDFWALQAMTVVPEDDLIALHGGLFDRFITMRLDGTDMQQYELPRDVFTTIREIGMYASPQDERIFWYDGQTNYTVKYDGTGLAACDGPRIVLPN